MQPRNDEHLDEVNLRDISDTGSGRNGSDEDVAVTWTKEEERTVRNKLDRQIVPMVTTLFLMCFLDRANIGNALIQGMEHDLSLVGYRFNWALVAYFIPYLIVEVPSNIVLKYYGPRIYIPALVLDFGFVSMCTAFVKDFRQLCVARALLGAFEGGVLPGRAFSLSSFYKREELYLRVGIFVSAAPMAGAFGGLLASGLTRIPTWGASSSPIHTWRNNFYFEGILTMMIGCIAPLIIPMKPETSNRLNDRERLIARERLRVEHRMDPDEPVRLHHIKRALMNINNYICAGGLFCIIITVHGLSVFMPSVLRDLGWKATKAQLLTVPVYVSAFLMIVLIAFFSDKTKMRGIYLACLTFLGITGFSILRWSQRESIRYMAIYFCAMAAFPAGPGFLSWALNNASGPAIRAVSGGYIMCLGTIGGIVAVWAYLSTDAPSYHIGHSINLTAQCIVLCLACFGIAYCRHENCLRARGGRDDRLEGLTGAEEHDLGYRHPEFRYII